MTWRKKVTLWDMVGAVALVVLLAFAPTYLAEGLVRPDATEKTTFQLPAPRAGDRMVLDLVATYRDQTPERLGRFVEVSFRAAEEGDPVGTHFVEVRTYPEIEVETDYLTYRSAAVTTHTYYHENGMVVWRGLDHAEAEESTSILLRPANQRDAMQEWAGARISYAPEYENLFTAAFVIAFDLTLRSGSGPVAYSVIADAVAQYQGERVYGSSHNVIMSMDETGVPTPNPDLPRTRMLCTGASMGVPIPGHGGSMRLTSAVFQEIFTAEQQEGKGIVCSDDATIDRWHWFHPDASIPAGGHTELRTLDGDPLVRVDVLPRIVERGSGEDLRAPDVHDPLKIPEAVERFLEENSPARETSLRALHQDDRPLLSNVSVASLVRLLQEPDAPDAAREALEAGAIVVGFSGHRLPPLTTLGPEPPLRLPVIGDMREVFLVERTAWVVALARPDGSITVTYLTVEERQTGSRIVDHGDACEQGNPWGIGVDCSSVAPGRVDPERPIVDVFDALDTWQEAARPVERITFMPILDGRLESSSRYNLSGPLVHQGTEQGLTPEFSAGAGSTWRIPTFRPDEGLLVLQTLGANVTMQIHDARHGSLLLWKAGPLRPEPASDRLQSASETTEMGFFVGMSRLGGGIAFLVFVAAALGRIGGALKAGAFYPLYLWFYAKIPRHAVLTHERRSALMDLLHAEPGITMSEVARRLGTGWGTTVHHLQTLESNGLAVRLRMGRSMHWFACGTSDPRERVWLAANQDPEQAHLLALAASRPVSGEEGAAHIGRSRSHTSRLLNRLVTLGLLEKSRNGRLVRFRVVSDSTPAHDVAIRPDGVVA